MSLRAIWIVSFPSGNEATQIPGRLLFERRFPTVECQAKKVDGDQHVSIPTQGEVESLLLAQLGLKSKNVGFNASRDSCARYNQKPAFEIVTSAGTLWPVLVIEQYGLIYCCLPLVEQGSSNRPPLISISGITVGLSLMMGMADFVGQLPPNVDETHQKFIELYTYLSQAAPFGRPIDVSTEIIRNTLNAKPSAAKPSQRLPAWRVNSSKPKSTIYLAVSEQIRTVQYDRSDAVNTWDVYGTVTCVTDIDGIMPEVSFNLTSSGPSPVPVGHLVVHPCVQSADAEILKNGSDMSATGGKSQGGLRKLRFTPPSEGFVLCHYSAKVPELPIRGFYQMKGEKKIELLMELKLNEKVKNSFSHCAVHLPFFHRGAIKQIENTQSCGTISQSSTDPRILIWTIGQKFPKNYEAVLKATLHFKEYDPSVSHGFVYEDPFCVGQNGYAQLFFKMADFTQTGCCVDPKSVNVMPPSKVKVTTVSEYSTSDYKIWNSHGDVLTTHQAPPQ